MRIKYEEMIEHAFKDTKKYFKDYMNTVSLETNVTTCPEFKVEPVYTQADLDAKQKELDKEKEEKLKKWADNPLITRKLVKTYTPTVYAEEQAKELELRYKEMTEGGKEVTRLLVYLLTYLPTYLLTRRGPRAARR